MESPVLTAEITHEGVRRLTVSYPPGAKASGLALASRVLRVIPALDQAIRRAVAPEESAASK